jgi:hypothetical protein
VQAVVETRERRLGPRRRRRVVSLTGPIVPDPQSTNATASPSNSPVDPDLLGTVDREYQWRGSFTDTTVLNGSR